MDFHPEVMPEAQQRVLKKLGEIIGDGFYLAGGTAIAIQLGHRESVDLDWFTMEAIAEPLGLAASLTAAGLGLTVTGSTAVSRRGRREDREDAEENREWHLHPTRFYMEGSRRRTAQSGVVVGRRGIGAPSDWGGLGRAL